MHQRKTLLGVIVLLAFVCLAGSQLIVHAAGGSNVPAIPPVNFAPPVNYTVGTLPFANAVADFNGDHILDVAVVNYNSNNVSILFGNGDGTFQPAVTYATGTEPSAITAIDLNNDGMPDLATRMRSVRPSASSSTRPMEPEPSNPPCSTRQGKRRAASSVETFAASALSISWSPIIWAAMLRCSWATVMAPSSHS